jgi:hypothetical protein
MTNDKDVQPEEVEFFMKNALVGRFMCTYVKSETIHLWLNEIWE